MNTPAIPSAGPYLRPKAILTGILPVAGLDPLYPEASAQSPLFAKENSQVGLLRREGFGLTMISLLCMITPFVYARVADAATSEIITYAGNGDHGYGGDGSKATVAELASPEGVKVYSGVLYIADAANGVIRTVQPAPSGIIATFAGDNAKNGSYSGDGGKAIDAGMNNPSDIVCTSANNCYIADTSNNVVRLVNSSGIISTFAGTGTAGYNGDGGAATKAELDKPDGLALDTSGNLYIADASNNAIREVNIKTNVINTIAGTGTAGYSGDGGQAVYANLSSPQGIWIDKNSNLFFADSGNYVVRKIVIATNIINTVAGTGTQGGYSNGASSSCSGDEATKANLTSVADVVTDASGNIYFGNYFNYGEPYGYAFVCEVVASTGKTQVIAGVDSIGYSGDGGPATSADLNTPTFLVFDPSGNLYIADTGNNRIRKIMTPTSSTTVTSLTADGDPEPVGAKVTFTADVAPSAGTTIPTGTVSFTIDGGTAVKIALDDTAHASYSTTSLTEGTHKAVAAYGGSTTFSSSTSPEVTETIFGEPSTLSAVSGSGQKSTVGQTFANPLIALVKDAKGDVVPGETITFTGKSLSFSDDAPVTDSNGEVYVTATPTASGSLTATASVGGSVKAITFTLTATEAAVAIPSFTPAAGTYTSTQSVKLADATSGATIYYTTNGDTPTTSSTKYTAAISVSKTETIKAIAVASNYTNSDVGSAAYTIK